MAQPLKHLKFCSTSIDQELRNDIGNKIQAMGGEHVRNLMSDVKYLIVGDNKSTEKFQYSVRKRGDIIFITPDSILRLHHNWINNKPLFDLDLESIQIFSDCNICVSRIIQDHHISDSNCKEKLIRYIKDNGGKVSESLTKANNILLTNDMSGKRVTAAREWNTLIIHPLWVLDSIKRKAPLELRFYDMNAVPVESIGKGSCEVWDQLPTRKKKKRIVTEGEEDHEDNDSENLKIKKRDPQIWKTIMVENKMLKNDPKKRDGMWDESLTEQSNMTHQTSSNPTAPNISKSSIFSSRLQPTIFKGKTFKLMFFSEIQTDTLRKVIESHNGLISTEEILSDVDFIIIPSSVKIDQLSISLQRKIKDSSINLEKTGSKFVLTEWFIERSLHYKKLTIDQWGLPFNRDISSKVLPPLKICISGFNGVELLHLSKLIDMIPNFELHGTLNGEKDVLIVNIDLFNTKKTQGFLTYKYPTLFKDDNNEKNVTSLKSTNTKMAFAKKNIIPIISISFLFEIFLNVEDKTININNKHWCLHCPKPDKLSKNLRLLLVRSERDEALENERARKVQLENKRKLERNIQETENLISKGLTRSPQKKRATTRLSPKKDDNTVLPDSESSLSNSVSDSFPKIPSPMRNKRANIGRIIGRASVSQFDINKEVDSTKYDHMTGIDEGDHDVRMTQIGYDIEDGGDKLLRLLKGDGELTENSTATKKSNTSRGKRTTRAAYKEILDIDLEN